MTPAQQFRLFIVRPTLEFLGLFSYAAEDLVVGTAIHESGGLKFFEQITGKDDMRFGPALGFFQIEPATHDDLWASFLRYHADIAERVNELIAPWPDRHKQLATNLSYGVAMCRLIYYRRPELLPPDGDIDGYAAYWKQHYNTPLGAGTAEQWAKEYRANCGDQS